MSALFIKRVCKRLGLRVAATCTAQVFLHRFFARQSEQQHDLYTVATTCIFLASKVEENVKNIEEIVEVAHAIRNNDKVERLTSESEAFTKLVNEVLFYERIVLCTLSFDLSVDHPHKHADKFVKMLCTGQSKEQQDLFQTTWNILNDSLSTTLCLTFSPRLIAAAAVSLATKFLSMRSSAQSAKPRYLEVFQKFEKSGKLFEYNLAEIRKVEVELVKFYESI